MQNINFPIKSISKDKVPKAYKGIVDQIAQGNEYWSVQLNVAVSKAIPLSKLSKLINSLSDAEQSAYKKMSLGLATDTDINLTNYVSLHKQAIEKLKEHTESTSTERNKLSGLKYPLSLVILARRALYAQKHEHHALESCSTDTFANYL